MFVHQDTIIRIPLGYPSEAGNLTCVISELSTEEGNVWPLEISIINSSVLVAFTELEEPLPKAKYYCILKSAGTPINIEMIEIV